MSQLPRLTGPAGHWMDQFVDVLSSRGVPEIARSGAISAVEQACHETGRPPWELFGDPISLAHDPTPLSQWLTSGQTSTSPGPRSGPGVFVGTSLSPSPAYRPTNRRGDVSPEAVSPVREMGSSQKILRRPQARGAYTLTDAKVSAQPLIFITLGYLASWPLATMVRAYRLGYQWVTIPPIALIFPAIFVGIIAVALIAPLVTRSLLVITSVILVTTLVGLLAAISLWAWYGAGDPWLNVHPLLIGGVGAVMLFLGCFAAQRGMMPGSREESRSWAATFILLALIASLWVVFDPHLEHVPDED